MSATEQANAFQTVVDQLKATYEPAEANTDLEPIRQLVYSFLLWDCTRTARTTPSSGSRKPTWT